MRSSYAADSNLFRLIYLSRQAHPTSTIEGRLLVNRIISLAITNNVRSGVSGALISFSGFFLQILEGDRGAVESTYGRICRDDRHHSLDVLSHGPITNRQFERAGLCGYIVEDSDPYAQTLSAFVARMKADKADEAAIAHPRPAAYSRNVLPKADFEEDGEFIYI